MEDELEKSVRYILRYCKEHGVFAYNDYMERSFNRSLIEVIKFHHKPKEANGEQE